METTSHLSTLEIIVGYSLVLGCTILFGLGSLRIIRYPSCKKKSLSKSSGIYIASVFYMLSELIRAMEFRIYIFRSTFFPVIFMGIICCLLVIDFVNVEWIITGNGGENKSIKSSVATVSLLGIVITTIGNYVLYTVTGSDPIFYSTERLLLCTFLFYVFILICVVYYSISSKRQLEYIEILMTFYRRIVIHQFFYCISTVIVYYNETRINPDLIFISLFSLIVEDFYIKYEEYARVNIYDIVKRTSFDLEKNCADLYYSDIYREIIKGNDMNLLAFFTKLEKNIDFDEFLLATKSGINSVDFKVKTQGNFYYDEETKSSFVNVYDLLTLRQSYKAVFYKLTGGYLTGGYNKYSQVHKTDEDTIDKQVKKQVELILNLSDLILEDTHAKDLDHYEWLMKYRGENDRVNVIIAIHNILEKLLIENFGSEFIKTEFLHSNEWKFIKQVGNDFSKYSELDIPFESELRYNEWLSKKNDCKWNYKFNLFNFRNRYETIEEKNEAHSIILELDDVSTGKEEDQ